jgi:hypothetical protein
VGRACLQAHPARHLGTSQMEKTPWGDLAGKFLAWRAPGLIPRGAGDLNGPPPAVFGSSQPSYEIARHGEATHAPRANGYEVRSLWGPAGAPSAPSGDGSDGKSSLGGLAGKSVAWRAPALIPRGAGDLNGLPPAVIEAVHRYMKSLSAGPLDFVFRTARKIRRGLHLL